MLLGILFFVVCMQIVQTILNVRYEMILSPKCAVFLRWACVSTGLQDLRYHDGEQDCYKFFCVHNHCSDSGRDILGNIDF